MPSDEIYSEKLFSYGTLQDEAVQLATFGRRLQGKSDTIVGYQLSSLEISDPSVVAVSGQAIHRVLIYTGQEVDKVSGVVFNISQRELQQSDEYEAADYQRIWVKLHSGVGAGVYWSQ